MNQDKLTGTVEGTGSAINVSIGFVPKKVKLFNIDDVGGLAPVMEWVQGMAAASAFKYLKIVDSGATGNASHDLVTSNGISEYVGTVAGVSEGFTIGADADMNVSGETIVWKAER